MDSKAGILLGFAGVVASLNALAPSITVVFSLGAATVAALLSLRAVAPRPFPMLDVIELRSSDIYRAADLPFVRLRIVDTRLDLLRRTKELLEVKAQRVRRASWALAVAVGLTAVGPIVALVKEVA